MERRGGQHDGHHGAGADGDLGGDLNSLSVGVAELGRVGVCPVHAGLRGAGGVAAARRGRSETLVGIFLHGPSSVEVEENSQCPLAYRCSGSQAVLQSSSNVFLFEEDPKRLGKSISESKDVRESS